MKLVIGHGSVEIVGINPAIRRLSMMVTMPCTLPEIKTPEVETMVLHKANFALWYLKEEGFVQKDSGAWFFHIGVVAGKGK
jgi:hypothetical protein